MAFYTATPTRFDVDAIKRAVPPCKPLQRRAVVALPGDIRIQAYAESLFADGLTIIVPKQLPRRQSCSISFEVPRNGTFHKVFANATVVCCALSGLQGFRVRMRFTDVKAQGVDDLAGLIG